MLGKLVSENDNLDFYKGVILTSFDRDYLIEMNVNNSDENYPVLASKLNLVGIKSTNISYDEVSKGSGIDMNTCVDMMINPMNYSLGEHWKIFKSIASASDAKS